MNYLNEDTQRLDLTTLGLGIGHKKGVMAFVSKEDIILSGLSEVLKVHKELGVECVVHKKDGERVNAGELILESFANAEQLHKAWKISQNLFEYMSGIATYTNAILTEARAINADISVATTRKNFPGSKRLMIKAVIDGGGVAHRLGTYDSILIFAQHREFFASLEEFQDSFSKLKKKFPEKKINVEVASYEDSLYFAKLGADILQCEKMAFDELKRCAKLKETYPHLVVMATGGINATNISEHAKTGVDVLVTSSPYHAKPKDIKVTMRAL